MKAHTQGKVSINTESDIKAKTKAEYAKHYKDQACDISKQLIAVVLYEIIINTSSTDKNYIMKKVKAKFHSINSIYRMMQTGIVNGKTFNAVDCIEFVKKYGIDLDKEISTEVIELEV